MLRPQYSLKQEFSKTNTRSDHVIQNLSLGNGESFCSLLLGGQKCLCAARVQF